MAAQEADPADDRPPAEVAPADAAQLAKDLKAKDYAVRLAAAEAALEEQDAQLTSALVGRLGDERFEVRTAVIKALGNRSDEAARRAAAKGLAARLPRLSKKPVDEAELLIAIAALHDLQQVGAIDALLDDISPTTSEDVARARVMAVANVPDKKAIEELIQFAARGGRHAMGRQRRIATDGLRHATGERLGADPDAWRAWWKENERTFDFAAAAREREEAEAERAEREERKKRKRKKKDD